MCVLRKGVEERVHTSGDGKREFRSFAVIIKEIDGGLAQLMSI